MTSQLFLFLSFVGRRPHVMAWCLLTLLLGLTAGNGTSTAWSDSTGEALLTGVSYVEPADLEAEIDWQATWRETHVATMTAWQAELADVEDAERRRQRERAREVRLLHELARRFPDAAQQDNAAMHQALLLERLAPHMDRGLRLLADRLETAEDDPQRAVELLTAMHERAGGLLNAGDWPAFVARHLLALHEAGQAVDDALRREALQRWFVQLRGQRRFFEARDVLRAIDQLEANDGTAWRAARLLAWVDFYMAAGLHDQAAARAEQVAAVVAEAGDGEADGELEALRLAAEQRLETIRDRVPNAMPPSLTMARDVAPELDRLRTASEIDESAIDRLYADPQIIGTLVERGPRHFASTWTELTGELANQPAASLAPLRLHQQRQAEAEARGRAPARPAEVGLMAHYRRSPWSEAGQRALLEAAERWLRRGELDLARRSLSDLLAQTVEGPLAERVRAGVERLASPVEPTAAAPASHPAGPAPAAAWRLPDASHAMPGHFDHAPPGDAVHLLRGQGLVGHERFALVAGPTLLARHDGSNDEPTWVRRHADATAGPRAAATSEVITLPGPFQPAVAGEVIVTRWGLAADERGAADVAAFDAADGEPIWTTAQHARWQTLQPVSDPVVAGQRVYVLARERQTAAFTPTVRVVVVALDLVRGDTLWVRPLATQATTIRLGSLDVDTIHSGNRVTVDDAAVYVTTGAGVNARLDARDGLVEWLQWYPRAPRREQWLEFAQRAGAAPQVFEDVIVLTPRDRSGALAVDRKTGETRWDEPLLPVNGVAGRWERAVVFYGQQALTSVDAGTGEVNWHRRLDQPLTVAPVSLGRRCHVVAGTRWLELDMASGEVTAQRDEASHAELLTLAINERGVVAVTAAPARRPLQHEAAQAVERDDASAMGNPFFHRAQFRRRPHATLWHLPDASAPPSDFLLYGGGWLERVSRPPHPQARWSRPVPVGLMHQHWHDGMVVLVSADRALAVDLADGALRWQTPLPFQPDASHQAGGHLVIGRHTDQFGYTIDQAAGIDLTTGRLMWERPLYLRWAPTITWDGERAYAITRGVNHPQAELLELDLDTGAVRERVAYQHAPEQMPEAEYTIHTADGVIALAADKQVYEVRPGDPSTVIHYPRLPEAFEFGASRFSTEFHLHDERWIEVRRYHGPPHFHRNFHQWLFDRHDPQVMIHRTSDGRLSGDLLLEPSPEEARLSVFHLTDQRELVTVDLPRRDQYRPVHVVDAWHEADRLYTLTTSARELEDAVIYLDAYDLATAEHLGGQTLTGVMSRQLSAGPGQTQLLRVADGFVLADAYGVHIFSPWQAP